MLAPGEVADLVDAHRRWGSTRELARQYGMHRHTVDRHLDRAGIVKRPVVKMSQETMRSDGGPALAKMPETDSSDLLVVNRSRNVTDSGMILKLEG